MSAENCTHNCSTCGENCASRTEPQDLIAPLAEGASVKHVYAVVSGKGGVGKSLVTSLLAAQTQLRGYQTAVLDADITGPSIPKAFGVHGQAAGGTHPADLAVFSFVDRDGQLRGLSGLLQHPDLSGTDRFPLQIGDGRQPLRRPGHPIKQHTQAE